MNTSSTSCAADAPLVKNRFLSATIRQPRAFAVACLPAHAIALGPLEPHVCDLTLDDVHAALAPVLLGNAYAGFSWVKHLHQNGQTKKRAREDLLSTGWCVVCIRCSRIWRTRGGASHGLLSVDVTYDRQGGDVVHYLITRGDQSETSFAETRIEGTELCDPGTCRAMCNTLQLHHAVDKADAKCVKPSRCCNNPSLTAAMRSSKFTKRRKMLTPLLIARAINRAAVRVFKHHRL